MSHTIILFVCNIAAHRSILIRTVRFRSLSLYLSHSPTACVGRRGEAADEGYIHVYLLVCLCVYICIYEYTYLPIHIYEYTYLPIQYVNIQVYTVRGVAARPHQGRRRAVKHTQAKPHTLPPAHKRTHTHGQARLRPRHRSRVAGPGRRRRRRRRRRCPGRRGLGRVPQLRGVVKPRPSRAARYALCPTPGRPGTAAPAPKKIPVVYCPGLGGQCVCVCWWVWGYGPAQGATSHLAAAAAG